VLEYRSVNNLRAAEAMGFISAAKISRSQARYADYRAARLLPMPHPLVSAHPVGNPL